MSGISLLERAGLNRPEALVCRFKEWADCYAFLQDLDVNRDEPRENLRIMADEIWDRVQAAKDELQEHEMYMLPPASYTELSVRAGAQARDLTTSYINDPAEIEMSTTATDLGRAIDLGRDSVKKSSVQNFISSSGLPFTKPSDSGIGSSGTISATSVGAKEMAQERAIPHIGRSRRALIASMFTKKKKKTAEEIDKLPRPVRSCLRRLSLLSRPSKLDGFPTAVIHFMIVENSSMIMVLVAWYLILVERLYDIYAGAARIDLDRVDSCSLDFVMKCLLEPWQDPYSRCYDDGSIASICEQMAEASEPLGTPRALIVCFWVPIVSLGVLLVYRVLLFLRYCSIGGKPVRPMSFARGQYTTFTWELARDRKHQNLLHLSAFLLIACFIVVCIHQTASKYEVGRGVGLSSVFKLFVMLEKLSSWSGASPIVHRFQTEPFFLKALFRRSWLSFLSETNFDFSNRVMDALWSCRAGNAEPMSKLLERKEFGGTHKPMEFYRSCEKVETTDADNNNRVKGASEEQIDNAAEMMFGETFENIEGSGPSSQALQDALRIQAETEAHIGATKDLFHQELEKSRRRKEQLKMEKQDALKRLHEKEREVEKLRALGEKLFSQDRELASLRREILETPSQDEMVAKLQDEVLRLRDELQAQGRGPAGKRTHLTLDLDFLHSAAGSIATGAQTLAHAGESTVTFKPESGAGSGSLPSSARGAPTPVWRPSEGAVAPSVMPLPKLLFTSLTPSNRARGLDPAEHAVGSTAT